ncbi:MAG: TetR family transcriptional regulator [Deltaproteobacteria bacterium]|nr:TetR family transcriptional regulator [Deltaproteobacteria bacterium]
MDEMRGRSPAPATGMKIARLAEAAGVSKSTIHNYVRKGLLPPPQKVGLSLFLYSQRHLEGLQEIRRLREEDGLTIDQISDALRTDEPVPAELRPSADRTREDEPSNETPVRTEESQEKRQLIIDKAIELFNQIGYERVRIADITDSLNMGKGTFYLYFRNKEDLLSECLTSLGGFIVPSAELMEVIRTSQDFFKRAQARFAGFQKQYRRFAGIMNLVRTASGSADPEISKRARSAYDAMIGPLRTDLKGALKEGSARRVDEELAVYALLGSADYVCYRATLDDRYTPREVAEFVQAWLESALRNGPRPTDNEAGAGGCSGRLVDVDGTATELRNVLFDKEPHIRGSLGRAAIELDPARVDSIAVRESDSTCIAEVRLKDGGTADLQVRGEVVVSGETALGTVRIPLRDVSSLTFSSSG